MKPEGVARRRMRASGLDDVRFERPQEVVKAHLAMQSQEFGAAKYSIGQRIGGLTDGEVERYVSSGSIVRTHVLRPTWHFVARSDARWLLALTGPRVQKGNAGRYRQLGLDAKTRARGERVIAKALSGGTHLTRKELGETLTRSGLDVEGQRLPHLLGHCELEALICNGGVRGKQQTYALFDERVPAGRPFDRDRAVRELVTRYLRGHGPATVKDMSWWSGLTMSDLRSAVEELGDRLEAEEIEGSTFWSLPEKDGRTTPRQRVHLLQAFDELIVGYTVSRFFGDPNERSARAAYWDRKMPNEFVLRGARVIGHWRRSSKQSSMGAEVLLYDEPTSAELAGLKKAAAEMGRFLERPVELSIARL